MVQSKTDNESNYIVLPNMDPIASDSMLHIRNAVVYDLGYSINAAKFPMRYDDFDIHRNMHGELGETQIRLAQCDPGTGHDNWLNGVRVAFDMDISAKMAIEAERYNFFNIVNSTSTMHRITKFSIDECYNKYVDPRIKEVMAKLIADYNRFPNDVKYLRILYSNPAGFTYSMRFTTNYRQLKTIYIQRQNHRLPEWREFCKWIETLPHSELITGVGLGKN